jgi:hypothetical protein
MAIIQSGGGAGTPLLVEAGVNAARVADFPMAVLGWQSIGVPTGLLPAGLAAGAAIFSLRNLSANSILVRRAGIGFVTTTAFTAAQLISFGLSVARNFTASDTGGTAIAFTGNNAKHRTSLGTANSLDARVATTAALGAGTRTIDANSVAMQAGWSGAAGTTIAPALNNLLSHDPGDYPILLAQNEGLLILNTAVFGAGGAGSAFIALEFAEVGAF